MVPRIRNVTFARRYNSSPSRAYKRIERMRYPTQNQYHVVPLETFFYFEARVLKPDVQLSPCPQRIDNSGSKTALKTLPSVPAMPSG